MDNNKKKAIILAFILLLSVLLVTLIIFIIFINIYEKDNNTQNQNIISTVEDESVASKEPTIEDVLKKHRSEYISQESTTIYVKFGEDLYKENGNSNEEYFIDIVEDLKQFFEKKSFKLIDEEKNIDVYAQYNASDDSYEIIFNGIKDFYKNTDGKSYVEVENVSIIEPSVLFISNGYLERLVLNDMYFSSIEKYLTESLELEDGYVSYPNERLKLKLAPNKTVQNIIFFDDYEGNILSDINMKMSLSEILELHPDNSSGSLRDEYLGYRNGDLYYFFYKDEVSVYGYSYNKNDNFEKLLTEYIEDKDLDKFAQGLKNKIKVYDKFEYDPDIKKLYMTFPTRGIEINIKDNNPKGITLYSNYYFTDITKNFVKRGLITLNSRVDLVQEYEKSRRENR